jgi:hypothetical protein
LRDLILDSSAAFAAQVALFVILRMRGFRSKKNPTPMPDRAHADCSGRDNRL